MKTYRILILVAVFVILGATSASAQIPQEYLDRSYIPSVREWIDLIMKTIVNAEWDDRSGVIGTITSDPDGNGRIHVLVYGEDPDILELGVSTVRVSLSAIAMILAQVEYGLTVGDFEVVIGNKEEVRLKYEDLISRHLANLSSLEHSLAH